MNLDVLGLNLHEGVLLTLGTSPGNELWASLGRREIVLCQIFASAHPDRPIRHISSSNWEELAASSANPGAFLLNLELEIAPLVLDYLANLTFFCLVGLYSKSDENSLAITFEGEIIDGVLSPNNEICACQYFNFDNLPLAREHFYQRVDDFRQAFSETVFRTQ